MEPPTQMVITNQLINTVRPCLIPVDPGVNSETDRQENEVNKVIL
jgi:hypothetical protein